MTGWDASATGVRVHLRNESVTASSLIITAGAWTEQIDASSQTSLAIKRKVIAWFDPLAPELFAADRIPIFTFPENFIYGFPSMPGLGVKLAEHYGGSYLPDADSFVPAPGRLTLIRSSPRQRNTCPGW